MTIVDICKWVGSKLAMRGRGRDEANGDYLIRYFVFRSKRFGIFLHNFKRSDEDRELHCHPWNGMSLILAGSYQEERLAADGSVETKIVRPGSLNFLKPDTFHRVDLQTPEVWSLFFVGTKQQTWGFKNRFTGEYWNWKDFFRMKGRPVTEADEDID